MTGSTFSRYEIAEKLGKGGMGEVFLARDPSLDRRVALKLLPEDLRHDETAKKRFRLTAPDLKSEGMDELFAEYEEKERRLREIY
ncbi:MAG TPA: hypothetical protein VEK15_06570 [Vicinamibacteria bacterium]|nr:hypothetical protein [Vicinamibacteria bacterium]